MFKKSLWIIGVMILGFALASSESPTATADPVSTLPVLPGFVVSASVNHISQAFSVQLNGGVASAVGIIQLNVTQNVAGQMTTSAVLVPVPLDATGNASFALPLSSLGIAGDFAAQISGFVSLSDLAINLHTTNNSCLLTSLQLNQVTGIQGYSPAAYQQIYEIVEGALSNGGNGVAMPTMPSVPVASAGISNAFVSDDSVNPLSGWGAGRWFQTVPLQSPAAPAAAALLSSGPAGVFGTN